MTAEVKVEESRLTVLFERISMATDQGRYTEALRLADSARRFAPENPTAILIYARLLLQTGDATSAARVLRGRDDPQSLILHASAALDARALDEAGASIRHLLARFAVDSWPELASNAARLCRSSPDRFPGWVGVDSNFRLVGAIWAGRTAHIDRGGMTLGRFTVAGETHSLVEFSKELRIGGREPIDVRVGDCHLLGSRVPWPPDFGFDGWVVLEGNCLHGEVGLDWYASAVTPVMVACGGAEIEATVEPASGGDTGSMFALAIDKCVPLGPYLHVSAVLPDGRSVPLTGSPIKSQQPLPTPIEPMRVRKAIALSAVANQPLVNIVVPVYAGLEETLVCLQSVLTTLRPDRATLTVVDDASPDPQLQEELQKLADAGRIHLLRNIDNLGFPGATNRGIRLYPDRDVILLNADTEVFDGWFDRLVAAANSDPSVGTVTPLGEAASIVSYGDSVSSAEAAVIDRVARVVNAERIVDLPVGVGFCMYIRRRCLDDVGDLDQLAFAKGYGEENDLCLRARARGWRHVAATNVFVRHLGGRSFGRAKQLLLRRNSRVLNFRYPGYDALIAEFLAADPLHAAKRAIDRHRLIQMARQPILMVSLDLPGGVKRHVDQRVASLGSSGHTLLVLRAVTGRDHAGRVVITMVGGEFAHLTYDAPRELDELRALLQDLALHAIEMHHFLGLAGPVLEMLMGLGVPYRVFVHDYAWICPRITLLNGTGVYCGEPAVETCEACVKTHGSLLAEPLTVTELRTRSAHIFARATGIVVPTQDVRTRLGRYFPGLGIQVQPWETRILSQCRPRLPRGNGRIRVAILGAINAKKGWFVLLECARDAVARQLPLEFVVIGYSSNDLPLLETGRVVMTGPYQEDEAAALLKREACDVALFATAGPETWCYTLTYVLAENLPIIAFDLGAVAERLRDAGVGELLPLGTSPSDINNALLRVAGDGIATAARSPEAYTPSCETPRNENFKGVDQTMPAANLVDSDGAPASSELAATVQLLTLPVGLYAFTVQSGGGAASGELLLPAFQVSSAPVRSAGAVEFQGGPATLDRWLTGSSDVVTVKVTGGDASLLLTSLRTPDSGVLSIAVRRLDAPASAPSESESRALPAVSQPLQLADTRVVTLVHVPYLGDLSFVEGWAGRPTENLWIEGFSMTVEEPAAPDLLEYCAITEEGQVTDWLTGGLFCGNRGRGVPLVAFAVRIKPDVALVYSCRYSGRFLSGTVIGPLDDGSLCRSHASRDPLVAIELQVEPVAAVNALTRV